jgi:hypothetical protein
MRLPLYEKRVKSLRRALLHKRFFERAERQKNPAKTEEASPPGFCER